MSPKVHANARKHFGRDRLSDEALLYAKNPLWRSVLSDAWLGPGDLHIPKCVLMHLMALGAF